MNSGTSRSGSLLLKAHPLIEIWRERKPLLAGIFLFGLVFWHLALVFLDRSLRWLITPEKWELETGETSFLDALDENIGHKDV